MPVEEYLLPESLDQALDLLAQYQDSLMVTAGGTVTMPLINEGVSVPEKVMGLKNTGLDFVREVDGTIYIGAMTRLSTLLSLGSVPILQEAARNTGAWGIRNLGTVGGNLFVPAPAGDVSVALLALEAEVKLVSRKDERWEQLSTFFTGFMSNILKPDELLTEIRASIPKGATAFQKYGRKLANTPAIVTVAASINLSNGQVTKARIGLGAAGPHPIRAYAAEAALEGESLNSGSIAAAAAAAADESQPFTDAIATEEYRRKMIKVYVARALTTLMEKEA